MTRLEEVQYLRTEPNGRHYNCAQSLLVPFGPQFGLDKEQADKLEAALDKCMFGEQKMVITGRDTGCTTEEFGNYVMETIQSL